MPIPPTKPSQPLTVGQVKEEMNMYNDMTYLDLGELYKSNRKDLAEERLKTMWNDLRYDVAERINEYIILQRYVNGEQWFKIWRHPKRRKATRNLCNRVVKVNTNLLGSPPIINAMKKSEFNISNDTEPVATDQESELQQVDVHEKVLFDWLTDDQIKFNKLLWHFTHNASKFGSGYFAMLGKGTKARLVQLFPGYVRVKYSSDDYERPDYVFFSIPRTLYDIKKTHNIEAQPDWEIDADISQTVSEYNYLDRTKKIALEKHFLDDKYHITIINNNIVEFEEHGCRDRKSRAKVPFWVFNNNEQPGYSHGRSDLTDSGMVYTNNEMGLQDNYNIINSDEMDIIEMFSYPRMVAMTDGLISSQAFQGETMNRVLKLPKGSDMKLLQFSGQIYQIEKHRDSLLDDISRATAIPKSAFAVPDSAIVTGAGVSAEWEPMVKNLKAKFNKYLSPILEDIFETYLRGVAASGEKDKETGKTYKEIIGDFIKFNVESSLQAPQDETTKIVNISNMVREGMMSRTTAIKKLNYVESVDDEVRTIAWEKNHPLLNPDLALKIAQLEQAGQKVEAKQLNLMNTKEDALYENTLMIKGVPVSVDEETQEELLIHLFIHNDFRDSDLYKRLSAEIKAAFDAHVAQTEQKLESAPTLADMNKQAQADAMAGSAPPSGSDLMGEAGPGPGPTVMPGENQPGSAQGLPPEGAPPPNQTNA